MEDNQLNLNQPFLSVRRYSSTPVSEKEDRKKNLKSQHPNIPRKLPHFKSDVKSGPVRNPGAIPFVWEQSPGKRKDENRHQIGYSERSSLAPKLPPGRVLKPDQLESDKFSVLQTTEKIQGGNSVKNKNGEGFSYDEDTILEDDSSDSTNNEVYVDALDTLSRTESFFWNCSVSGVSGFEDVQTPCVFSTDPQAKDFMIGRFLPAAKAMASESPQITQPKKQQPIVSDQPRQPKKIVNGDKGPQLRYGPSFQKQHAEYYDSGEENSDDDFDESEVLQAKVCGIVPRFFLKGSHCLLNRIPAKSVRTTRLPPLSPASREGTRSSASSWSKTEHEHSSFDTSGRKSIDGSLTIDLHEEKNDLNMKTEHISSKLEGTYPHEMPHYANESKNTSIVDLNLPVTGYKSFKDMLSDKNSSEEFLEVEKNVYVDSIRTRKELCPPSRNDQDIDKEYAFRNEPNAVNVLALRSDVPKAFGQDQKSYKDAKFEFTEKDISISTKKQIIEAENSGNNGGGIFPNFSIPPPLPKSPSDSWLWRTLPSISSKNSSSHSYFGAGPSPRYQVSMTSDVSKWSENMFKTSKTQELLAPIPEN